MAGVIAIVGMIILSGGITNMTGAQISAGDTGWVLVCCSLVLLMTPALAFFLRGNGQKKKHAFHVNPEFHFHVPDRRAVDSLRVYICFRARILKG